jgi:general secretion pathway protein B
MSYILDALKKAERERGVAQVPTLSTVHDLRTKRPVRLWTTSGIVALCIVAFVLFYFLRSDAGDEVMPSVAKGTDSPAGGPEPVPLKAQASVEEIPAPVLPAESRAIPAMSFEAGNEMTDREGREPITQEPQTIQADRPSAAGSAATELSSVETAPERPPQELTEVPAPESQMETADVEAPEPLPVAAREDLASLQDAVENMAMSILLYSENKAERLVFINGRKYVEGDTVEGSYLLESITPDGAVISYGGERIVLRPDRN